MDMLPGKCRPGRGPRAAPGPVCTVVGSGVAAASSPHPSVCGTRTQVRRWALPRRSSGGRARDGVVARAGASQLAEPRGPPRACRQRGERGWGSSVLSVPNCEEPYLTVVLCLPSFAGKCLYETFAYMFPVNVVII